VLGVASVDAAHAGEDGVPAGGEVPGGEVADARGGTGDQDDRRDWLLLEVGWVVADDRLRGP